MFRHVFFCHSDPEFGISKAAADDKVEVSFWIFMSRNAKRFVSKYHHVGNQHLTIRAVDESVCGTAIRFVISKLDVSLLRFVSRQRGKGALPWALH
jgi:hypothetical protein